MEEIKYFHQPTISESLGNGWFVMKKYFLWLLLVVIICGLFDSPSKFGYNFNSHNGVTSNPFRDFPGILGLVALGILVALFVFFLVKPVISYGAKLIYLKCTRDIDPDLKDLFLGFQRNYFDIVLANLLVFIIVVFGCVFLLIPGIIFACRLAFVPYLVMDKKLDPVKAVEESWRMTKGYGWTIFGLALMSIPIVIAGFICLIVGVFPALILINSSFASLYQAVENAEKSDQKASEMGIVV
jgi:uncharacterized membrane protein